MKTKQIVLYAFFIALIAIMTLVPNLGFIQFWIISISLVQIPVLIMTLKEGYQAGLVSGLAFGLFGYYAALTRASTGDLVFQNPFVSVLPRVLFPLITYFIYQMLIKYHGKEANDVRISAFIGSLLHTLLVLGMIYITQFSSLGDPNSPLLGYMKFIIPVISVNGLVEAILAGMIVYPVINRLKKL